MKKTFLSVTATVWFASTSSAALSVGSLGIVAFADNGTPDSFTVVALDALAAGETVYFTDNGWTGSAFRGASATDGDGGETFLKLTLNNPIAPGTLLSTSATGSDFTWTAAGSIPGTSSGSFGSLSLATSGDQIYAFQGPTENPLFNPTNFLFVLDSTNGFEAAISAGTGDVPTGLSVGSHTAVSLPTSLQGGSFGLNPADPDVQALQAAGGTPSQWRAVIAQGGKWTANPTFPESLNVVPEPSSLLLSCIGIGGILRRRR